MPPGRLWSVWWRWVLSRVPEDGGWQGPRDPEAEGWQAIPHLPCRAACECGQEVRPLIFLFIYLFISCRYENTHTHLVPWNCGGLPPPTCPVGDSSSRVMEQLGSRPVDASPPPGLRGRADGNWMGSVWAAVILQWWLSEYQQWSITCISPKAENGFKKCHHDDLQAIRLLIWNQLALKRMSWEITGGRTSLPHRDTI